MRFNLQLPTRTVGVIRHWQGFDGPENSPVGEMPVIGKIPRLAE